MAEEDGFSTVSCEDGGATFYVHDRAACVVRDHTTAQFPEVVAIEFEKAFFNTRSNVIVVVAYISCSELEASKKYINVHQTPQLAALSEPLCNFRAAGFQVLFFGDVNGYVLDFNGYDGCESEYDAEIDATTFSGVDLPLRRASLCSHTRRNSNGKEFLSLCIAAELIIVNGVRGEKFFDSGCTRDSCRAIDGGGSVIDFFACSAEIFGQLQSLHVSEKTHFSDHNKLLLSWTGSSSVSRAPTSQDTQARQQIVADGPKGWCFVGSLNEDAKLKFAERVASDSRLKEVEAICCKGNFRQEDK